MQRLVGAYGFGLFIAVTAGCERSVPVGVEGKSCARVGATTSNDEGCCTCNEDKTWQCTDRECSSGSGGTSGGGATTGTGGSKSGTATTPNEIPQDPRLMGDGTSNRTGLGGYWWTHVDRSGRSRIDPYTGKVDPLDTWTYPAKLAGAVGVGTGIEDGAYRVRGYVGDEPAYDSVEEEDMDRYWDGFYALPRSIIGAPDTSDFCDGDSCEEMAYPMAGLAFGFQNRNAPLGVLAADKVGIAFKMKLGPGHGLDEDGKPFRIDVELPLDLTDAPDPTLGDQFGTQYAGLGTPNLPLCTFANSPKGEDGQVVGRAEKGCFRHLSTWGNTDLELTTEWQTFCLAWNTFGAPPFPPESLIGVSVAEQRARLIKVQFEAFRPSQGGMNFANFDFYVDDVWLLDQAKWDELCASAVIPQ